MVSLPTPLNSAGEIYSSASSEPASTVYDLSDLLRGLEPTLKSKSTTFANGDESLAEDLYQEGAMAAVTAAFSYNPAIGSLEGYAAWRAINRMRDVKRSHVARVAHIAPPLEDEDPAAGDEGAVAALVDGIDAASLRPLLVRVLTERQREVVEALYYMNLTSSEVGLLLRITQQRVNQVHVVALQKLRAALGVPVEGKAN